MFLGDAGSGIHRPHSQLKGRKLEMEFIFRFSSKTWNSSTLIIPSHGSEIRPFPLEFYIRCESKAASARLAVR